MKKFTRYFDDLFNRFDLWFFFVSIALILFAFYRRDLSDIPTIEKYMLVSLPLLILLGNIGNLKKQANLLDVFSIILFFVYLYFSISEPQVYTILIPCLLLTEIIMRIVFYSLETTSNQQNPSKSFYAHLNYRFPLVVMILLGISFAFATYYSMFNGSEQVQAYFQTALFVCSTIIPLFYLILVSVLERNKIHFLDYAYFVLCAFIIGTILLFYPQGSTIYSIFTMILPFLILCIRAHTYDGVMELKKKKYVSALLKQYHPILIFIVGYGLSYLLAFSSKNALFDLHQNIYLAIIAGGSVLLCILLFLTKNLKAHVIKPVDYLFFLLSSILYFTFIYVLSVALDMYGAAFRKSFFEDMITLISLFVLLICLFVFLILYFIRYRYFFKSIEVEEAPQEDVIEEPVEEIHQEVEELAEEQLEEPESVEEEVVTPLVEESIEEPAMEEEPEEDLVEDLKEEEAEELEPIVKESVVESGEIKIVIPDDESQNHMTKVKYYGKLMFSDRKLKELYSEVKNYLCSYGATSRIASTKETFKKKGTLAVIRLGGKTLNVYLAILPEPFLEEDYHIKDMQGVKQYEETPTMLKIKTKRSLKEFKEIVDVMMIHRDIKKKAHYKKVDYEAELIPNGEAILNALGYSSDYLVPSISAKIIPTDMPADLERFIPSLEQPALSQDVNYTPVYLDTLCNYYEDGAVVTKEDLIAKKIIKSAEAIVIKSRGTLDKKLTIYADLFESDALKMIYITNGTAVKINHSSND